MMQEKIPLTREQAKDIVVLFLNRVHWESLEETGVIYWETIFKSAMSTQSWCLNLLNEIAGHYMNDYVSYHISHDEWEEYLKIPDNPDDSNEKTIGKFIDFVKEKM